jgi:hypothetical protein
MRALSTQEMVMVFRLTRSCLFAGGAGLFGFGLWYVLEPMIYNVGNPLSSLGIFPIYVGGMLILIALAMKEDWFTNARRYW